MNSLRGAKVLLVDNDPKDALPVIKAFAQKGISVVYFTGEIDELPKEKDRPKGIRLAILDMDIVGGGDTDKNKISALIGRLEIILHPENGPYAMIAWTQHPDLVHQLEETMINLKEEDGSPSSIPVPLMSVILEKAEFRDGESFDFERLALRLQSAMESFFPLVILQFWEERVGQAATEVVNTLSHMCILSAPTMRERAEQWNNQITPLLKIMAKEVIGEGNLTPQTMLPALFDALNPLHADFMEFMTDQIAEVPQEYVQFGDAERRITSETKAKINTKLHISLQAINQYQPGNIYKILDFKDLEETLPRSVFEDMAKDAYKEDDELFKVVTPILIEVSAACDYTQQKIRYCRFLAGLIIPADQTEKFKKPEGFLLSLGSLWLDDKENIFIISSRHQISFDLAKVKDGMKAISRIRRQALVYIQSWLGKQISRPGIMSLR